VRDLGLERASDDAVWARAAADGFIIATKDDDFRQRSFLQGPPPKVLWVRFGNCRTTEISAALRARAPEVEVFAADATAALLVLMRRR
jgi:predicted nuclease of predicted toxin-antitoxin system